MMEAAEGRFPWPGVQVLEGLPPEIVGSLVLCSIGRRSYREAARLLGESEDTVKRRLRIGLRLIHNMTRMIEVEQEKAESPRAVLARGL